MAKANRTGRSVAVRTRKELEPVPEYPAGREITVGALKFKVIKHVTLPHLQQPETVALGIKILSPIYTGNQLPKTDKDGKAIVVEDKQKPPQLVRCINLEDGGEYTYIVAAVPESQLKLEYPNDGYVGRSFVILKGPKKEGKRYFQYAVQEIEITE